MPGSITTEQREQLTSLLARFIWLAEPRPYGAEFSEDKRHAQLKQELDRSIPATWDQLPYWIDRAIAKHPGQYTPFGELIGAILAIAAGSRP